MIRIYIHKTCPTSIELINEIEKIGLKDMDIVDVEKSPFKAISRGYVSVPTIEIDGEIFDFGPVDIQGFIQYIREKQSPDPTQEILDRIIATILDNIFLALSIYLRGDISAILDYKPLLALLERNYGIKNVQLAFKNIQENNKEIYSQIEEKLLKTIAYGFIKELYYIHHKKLPIDYFERYTYEIFLHWTLARSSISRIGLISCVDKQDFREKVLKLMDVIKENWYKYWDKVVK